jgi:hypothetical protein
MLDSLTENMKTLTGNDHPLEEAILGGARDGLRLKILHTMKKSIAVNALPGNSCLTKGM